MYERFFGLVDAPFRLTPDPRYFFLSTHHADALAHLRLGLTESSGFVCITGDVGTGKTTLLRAYLADLGSDVATAYIFNPSLTPLELLQTINRELGLPAASTSPKVLVDELSDHLLSQRAAGRRSVVVVDEAQALSIEALEQLRLLSNLETATEKLLRIVLVGQPPLPPRRTARPRVAGAMLGAGACAGLIALGVARLISGPAGRDGWAGAKVEAEGPAGDDTGAVAMLMTGPEVNPDPATPLTTVDTPVADTETGPTTLEPPPPAARAPSSEIDRTLAAMSRAASAHAAV